MTDVKHILITGSSGFLGQHILYDLFLAPGESCPLRDDAGPLHVHALYGSHKDFAAAVQSYPVDQSSNIKVTVESLDLTDKDAVKTWLTRHETMHVCIHTAALSSPRVCQQDADKAAAINIPTDFFQGLCQKGCRIIALSTDQVYQGTSQALYKESDPAKPVNVYGQTKLKMEDTLRSLSNKNNAVLLRSSIILGRKAPLTTAHDTFLHFCATREGRPTDFYTDECRSVVFVQDVVYTIGWFTNELLIRREEDADNDSLGGIYNMGGPTSVSRVDMARAVFAHLGYDPVGSIVPNQKVTMPPGPVPSPLDISMDSSKLEELLQRTFAPLDVMMPSVFPR